jgi:hypothetical protein
MNEMRQFLIYQSEDGSTRIDAMLEAETLWMPVTFNTGRVTRSGTTS